MKYVYITTDKHNEEPMVYSSKGKAEESWNHACDFEWLEDAARVTNSGTHIGWITKTILR